MVGDEERVIFVGDVVDVVDFDAEPLVVQRRQYWQYYVFGEVGVEVEFVDVVVVGEVVVHER